MRKLLFALALLASGSAFAADNYTATQGTGTTFGAKDNGGGVLFPRFIGCDNTTTTQCWVVDSSGRLTVNLGSANVTNAGTFAVQATVASGGLAAGSHAAGSGVDGWDLTQGAKADTVCGSATGTCTITSLIKFLNSQAILPLPAQTGIGNVNIGAVQSAGSKFIAVAAGSTATVLQTSTGAAGDYLSHCDIYPTSTSPGVVTVFDNTNTAANSVILFPGGASSLSNLAPFPMPVGAISVAGAWKVTTGTAISVVCYGKFS